MGGLAAFLSVLSKSRQTGLQMAHFCASVLTYLNVRSAPMLENRHFRRGLPLFDSDTKVAAQTLLSEEVDEQFG